MPDVTVTVPDRVCPNCGAHSNGERLTACLRCVVIGEIPRVVVDDRLELGDEIGAGGMGVVFRARHLRLDREVAVKVLPAHYARNEDFRQRFEREGKALASLDHPHIVQVYDSGEADGQLYLVMELVDGQPLGTLLPLKPAEATRIMRDVCEALQYAHARGVVHRDIKPSNILVDAAGRAKVVDFGIARRNAIGEDPLTRPNILLGTDGYLAPELSTGQPASEQSDLFAFGVTFYQALTGKRPAGSLRPLPRKLSPVILKAMAPDPADRYQSAADLLADLSTARVRAPRTRVAMTGLAAGAALVIGLAVFWPRGSVRVVHGVSGTFALNQRVSLDPELLAQTREDPACETEAWYTADEMVTRVAGEVRHVEVNGTFFNHSAASCAVSRLTLSAYAGGNRYDATQSVGLRARPGREVGYRFSFELPATAAAPIRIAAGSVDAPYVALDLDPEAGTTTVRSR